jgi:hypothetical protein
LQSLAIEAKSLESAQGLFRALSEFDPRLVGDEREGFRVVVKVGTDRRLLAVLDALEQHVTQRQDGPARVDLQGRRYTVHSE